MANSRADLGGTGPLSDGLGLFDQLPLLDMAGEPAQMPCFLKAGILRFSSDK